ILEQMAAEEPGNGRAVEIRRLQPLQALDEVHVLFVGQTLENDAATMLREALAESVLTVTEANTQRPDDSVINFMIAGDRVAFDISLIAARRADLQLSSRLLQVAQRVIE